MLLSLSGVDSEPPLSFPSNANRPASGLSVDIASAAMYIEAATESVTSFATILWIVNPPCELW